MAETEFSSARVGQEIVALYRKLLRIPPGPLRSFPRPAGWA
jgi:hypothetical protein